MNVNYLRSWLSNCPYITGPITVDCLDEAPDAVALFPEDTRELSRRQDVLGDVWVTCRDSFSLYWRAPRLSDASGYAQWLLNLQQWVQQQNVQGTISQPGITCMQAQASEGRLQEDTADGMCVYKVWLDVEYTKTYLATK